jgi:formate-dependent phosphoribosylglycinamide formyltransferase (GAR transformylase)
MKDIKDKRLLLLGSTVWKELIKSFADYYGVRLYFAGLYPSPLDNIVEEYYRIDTTDPDVMIPFVLEHQFDGVYMGGSEFIVSHACVWINKLGLPCYCEKEQWEILQNKILFKDLCIRYGLPVVPQFIIDPNNIASSVNTEDYPVITKPTDGSGSNGFSVCHNARELALGYQKAANNSPSKSVICEKFVNNKGLVVYFVFSDGEMHFVMTQDKYPVRYDKQGSYVAGMHTFPSYVESRFKILFEEKLRSLFKGIGIKNGTIWIEVFYDGNSFYFNEVGYRYSGSFSFYPLDYRKGINQFYGDLYYAITGESILYGLPSLIPDTITKGLKYCIYSIHCKPGKVFKEKGIDDIREKYPDRIVVVPHQRNVGDTILETGSFGQVFCLFHFVYKTNEECKDIIRFIQEKYRVLDAEGNNLVLKKIDVDKLYIHE